MERFIDFQAKDFSVSTFIEQVIRKAPPVRTSASPNPTSQDHDDLLPFITALEAQLKELRALQHQIDAKVIEVSGAIESGVEDIRNGNRGLEDAVKAEMLDETFDRLSHEIIEKGRHLNSLIEQQSRADRVCQILDTLANFPQKRLELEQTILGTDASCEADQVAAASVLRVLLNISDEQIPVTECQAISECAHAAKARLQSDFMDALQVEDVAAMHTSYRLVKELTGDATECREAFARTHSLVNNVPKPDPSSLKSAFYMQPHQKSVAPAIIRCGREQPVEPLVAQVLDEVMHTIEHDYEYFVDIFGKTDTKQVATLIVQQVIKDRLRVIIVECQRQSRQHSYLAHQRVFAALFRCLTVFCADLDTLLNDGVTEVGGVSDAIDTIIQPFLKSFPQDERSCLEDLLRIASRPFMQSIMKQKQEAKVKLAYSAPNAAAVNVFSATLFMFEDGSPLVVAEKEGADGVISMEVVQRCLVLLGEAAERVNRLVACSTAEHLLPALLSTVLHHFVVECAGEAIDFICSPEGRTKYGFEPAHIRLAQSVHTLLNLAQMHFERHYAIIAAAVSPGCYAECLRVKGEHFKWAEGRLAQLLSVQSTRVVDFAKDFYLKPQRKSDFCPKQDEQEAVLSRSRSPSCEQFVLYVRKMSISVKQFMEEGIAGPWLFDLGIRILRVLLDHIRRQSVNGTGALALAKDCSHYAFNIPRDLLSGLTGFPWETHLAVYFDILRELSKLYVVKVENLKSVMQEGIFAGIDHKLLYPFIMGRAGVKLERVERYFSDFDLDMMSKLSI